MNARVSRRISLFRIGIFSAVVLCTVGGPCFGWWPIGGWGPWGLFPGFGARTSDFERLPHFSLFPPVYYSHPVRYPYGSSPFARLPEWNTVLEALSAGPVCVRNPFARSIKNHPKEELSPSGPLVVKNLFFEHGEKTGLDKPGEIANLTAPSK